MFGARKIHVQPLYPQLGLQLVGSCFKFVYSRIYELLTEKCEGKNADSSIAKTFYRLFRMMASVVTTLNSDMVAHAK